MTRTPDTAPSQSADLIADLKDVVSVLHGERLVVSADTVGQAITALRAAEGKVNTVWDTIRHYQDCAKAAEARELVLSNALRAAEAENARLREYPTWVMEQEEIVKPWLGKFFGLGPHPKGPTHVDPLPIHAIWGFFGRARRALGGRP